MAQKRKCRAASPKAMKMRAKTHRATAQSTMRPQLLSHACEPVAAVVLPFLDGASLVQLQSVGILGGMPITMLKEEVTRRWQSFQHDWQTFLEAADQITFSLGSSGECRDAEKMQRETSAEMGSSIFMEFNMRLTCHMRLTRCGELQTTRSFFFKAGTVVFARDVYSRIDKAHRRPLPKADMERLQRLQTYLRDLCFHSTDLFGQVQEVLNKERHSPGSACMLDLVGDRRKNTWLRAQGACHRSGTRCCQNLDLSWDA
eukprot:TRINITY_DN2754_c0_g1_i2.p1 TRINITY_DN2754_c0_g1~~TRINITY_DN2754_c0_g1_i2.p1  ORF type:complete len:265 (+),score=48.94 TRINITY_DN2754_c0_g1_i2:24-797(+)